MGGFVRSTWDEVNQIIAAANVYTIKKHGPDRIIGFSPIPAMSMVSYAAGSRYLSLIGGVCMSFYDWYCDLPPSSPQVWGEQTDVPESADWYNSTYIIAWGSNVPQTRTPDAHFFTEVRYKGTKTVAVTPDYSEVAKLADLWMHPKQGTDAALAMAMGHVILNEFYFNKRSAYFDDYARRYTDLPLLVMLEEHTLPDGRKPGARPLPARQRLQRQARPGQQPRVEDGGLRRPTAGRAAQRQHRFPLGRRRPRRRGQVEPGEQGSAHGATVKLKLSVMEDGEQAHDVATSAFPYFGGIADAPLHANAQQGGQRRLVRRVPVRIWRWARTASSARCWWPRCSTCRWPTTASTAACLVKRGELRRRRALHAGLAGSITGVPREQIITVARQFADNADKTQGKSMVIIGAAMNHWYHCDMNYRGIINMLMMCGCIGQSGGGWAHYVGQEKLRPQTGWTALAFALDWIRPPRQMNSTSFFYAHTDQWRYEKLGMEEMSRPLADKEAYGGSMIDYNVRAERMGWLPSRAAAQDQPAAGGQGRRGAGMDPRTTWCKRAQGRHAAR
jgi:nitrate reductase alpha subunit